MGKKLHLSLVVLTLSLHSCMPIGKTLLPGFEISESSGLTPSDEETSPKTEEPKTEEPKTEEPKTEEPKTEEPKTEEPKTEEPKTEEPKTEEPKTEEPKTEEPAKEYIDENSYSLVLPQENLSILTGTKVPVELVGSLPLENIQKVSYYLNSKLIEESAEAPFSQVIETSEPGSSSIEAVAELNNGKYWKSPKKIIIVANRAELKPILAFEGQRYYPKNASGAEIRDEHFVEFLLTPSLINKDKEDSVLEWKIFIDEKEHPFELIVSEDHSTQLHIRMMRQAYLAHHRFQIQAVTKKSGLLGSDVRYISKPETNVYYGNATPIPVLNHEIKEENGKKVLNLNIGGKFSSSVPSEKVYISSANIDNDPLYPSKGKVIKLEPVADNNFGAGTASLAISDIAPGSYKFGLVVKDSDHTSSGRLEKIISVGKLGNLAPSVNIRVSYSFVSEDGTTPPLYVMAEDTDGKIVKVELYDGNNLIGTKLIPDNIVTGKPVYEFKNAYTEVGLHRIWAKVIDDKGDYGISFKYDALISE